MNARAKFTHMEDGSVEDWSIIAQDFAAYATQLPVDVTAKTHTARSKRPATRAARS